MQSDNVYIDDIIIMRHIAAEEVFKYIQFRLQSHKEKVSQNIRKKLKRNDSKIHKALFENKPVY